MATIVATKAPRSCIWGTPSSEQMSGKDDVDVDVDDDDDDTSGKKPSPFPSSTEDDDADEQHEQQQLHHHQQPSAAAAAPAGVMPDGHVETERLERRRRMNMIHSRRKRQRRKIEVEVLKEQVDMLTSSNQQLRTENQQMEALVAQIHQVAATGAGDSNSNPIPAAAVVGAAGALQLLAPSSSIGTDGGRSPTVLLGAAPAAAAAAVAPPPCAAPQQQQPMIMVGQPAIPAQLAFPAAGAAGMLNNADFFLQLQQQQNQLAIQQVLQYHLLTSMLAQPFIQQHPGAAPTMNSLLGHPAVSMPDLLQLMGQLQGISGLLPAGGGGGVDMSSMLPPAATPAGGAEYQPSPSLDLPAQQTIDQQQRPRTGSVDMTQKQLYVRSAEGKQPDDDDDNNEARNNKIPTQCDRE